MIEHLAERGDRAGAIACELRRLRASSACRLAARASPEPTAIMPRESAA